MHKWHVFAATVATGIALQGWLSFGELAVAETANKDQCVVTISGQAFPDGTRLPIVCEQLDTSKQYEIRSDGQMTVAGADKNVGSEMRAQLLNAKGDPFPGQQMYRDTNKPPKDTGDSAAAWTFISPALRTTDGRIAGFLFVACTNAGSKPCRIIGGSTWKVCVFGSNCSTQ